jgi:hypothetical protein
LTGSFIQRLVFVGSVQHCPASQTQRLAVAPVPKRKAILVLGVHRSGTSSLAHLLNVLGAKLPEELLGPGHGNPLGHWEPKRLIQINKAILAAFDNAQSKISSLHRSQIFREFVSDAG